MYVKVVGPCFISLFTRGVLHYTWPYPSSKDCIWEEDNTYTSKLNLYSKVYESDIGGFFFLFLLILLWYKMRMFICINLVGCVCLDALSLSKKNIMRDIERKDMLKRCDYKWFCISKCSKNPLLMNFRVKVFFLIFCKIITY
jgi:hypothetical protein